MAETARRRRRKPARGTGGGIATRERHGIEHFKAMNRLSQEARAARAARPAEETPTEAHLLLPRWFLARVTALARELGISRTALIRLALEDYLAACEGVQKKTPDR